MTGHAGPVVVTGAAGRLGSRLVPWLEKAGREVRPVDIRAFDHPRAVVDDLAQLLDRTDWMSGARALVHLAGVADNQSPWSAVERANVLATQNMVIAAKLHGVQRFVLASSVWAMRAQWQTGGTVGTGLALPGDNEYGKSKAAAEALLAAVIDNEAINDGAAAGGLSAVVLRIGGRVVGDYPPRRLDAWEDSCWLGWNDFFHGVDRALDAPVNGLVTINLVSANPAGRWSLDEGRELIGYEPRQSFAPASPSSALQRARQRVLKMCLNRQG